MFNNYLLLPSAHTTLYQYFNQHYFSVMTLNQPSLMFIQHCMPAGLMTVPKVFFSVEGPVCLTSYVFYHRYISTCFKVLLSNA